MSDTTKRTTTITRQQAFNMRSALNSLNGKTTTVGQNGQREYVPIKDSDGKPVTNRFKNHQKTLWNLTKCRNNLEKICEETQETNSEAMKSAIELQEADLTPKVKREKISDKLEGFLSRIPTKEEFTKQELTNIVQNGVQTVLSRVLMDGNDSAFNEESAKHLKEPVEVLLNPVKYDDLDLENNENIGMDELGPLLGLVIKE